MRLVAGESRIYFLAKNGLGLQKQRVSVVLHTAIAEQIPSSSTQIVNDVLFIYLFFHTRALSPGCQAVRCCQVICRAVGQLSGTVRCLCQTSCQVLSVLSGAVGCVSDIRGAL